MLKSTAIVWAIVLLSLSNNSAEGTALRWQQRAATDKTAVVPAAEVQIEFAVQLEGVDATLANFERVALVGEPRELGGWRVERAIPLSRSAEHYNLWTTVVALPTDAGDISYRYFIATEDSVTGALVQVRRWESHVAARTLDVSVVNAGRTADVFGEIDGGERDVQRGWLHTGHIVQFKLFRNPLKVDADLPIAGEQLRVKLQAVDAKTLRPLQASARAHTEYVRMEYGNSWLREQPEFGVPYESDDIVIFHTTLSEAAALSADVGYLLKVYAVLESSDLVRLIGYQHIQPELLRGAEGKLTVDLISPVWVYKIGSLELQYLVVTPLPHGGIDMHTSFVNYWRSNWTTLDVGHRGLGRSLTQLINAPQVIENTIASMKASVDLGADMVEFDVMLTSDLVPIIYHDYAIHIYTGTGTPTSNSDLTDVLIKDLTYAELKNLKTYQVVGNEVVEYPAHNTVSQSDERLFPLFAEFLTEIDQSVGFDIEIKWPQLKRIGGYESEQTIDKNLYIDRILEVMLQHGCGRLSFFTSFDADICTLLRYKQNMYPVMFLSSSVLSNYADPRSDSVTDTVNNAQAFDLAGIVPNAAVIRLDPSWIEMATRQDKKVFLWGDALSDTESIQWFKDLRPTGVIYDRLDLWLPPGKQSVFTEESDMPDFFQLQCTDSTWEEPSEDLKYDFY